MKKKILGSKGRFELQMMKSVFKEESSQDGKEQKMRKSDSEKYKQKPQMDKTVLMKYTNKDRLDVVFVHTPLLQMRRCSPEMSMRALWHPSNQACLKTEIKITFFLEQCRAKTNGHGIRTPMNKW
jgi:hypothetical protein